MSSARLSSTLPGARVTRSLPLPLSKGGVSPAQHRALSQRDGPPRWPAGPVLAKPTSQRGDRPEQTGRPDDLRAWEETRMTNKQRMDTWTPGEGGRGRCPTPGAVPSPPRRPPAAVLKHCWSRRLASCVPKAQNAGVCTSILIPFLDTLLRLGPLINLVFGRRLGSKRLAKDVSLAQAEPPTTSVQIRVLTAPGTRRCRSRPLPARPLPAPLLLCGPRAGRARRTGDRRACVSRSCAL